MGRAYGSRAAVARLRYGGPLGSCVEGTLKSEGRLPAGAWADERERRIADALSEALQVELSRLGHKVASPWCGRPDLPRDVGLELQVYWLSP